MTRGEGSQSPPKPPPIASTHTAPESSPCSSSSRSDCYGLDRISAQGVDKR
ncbi:hypothetical protein PtA15_9A167 [Puccinia triticina]|uniref:Uncharacterized protein n=1 Tax=Puccinia triticina TaxID=208348 RepID=A0ABY7CUB9_9BASI|nr:uncharacterized protein PtA15_9A167 [Puccinia triticina]WAQ88042.1 hypothetical protein PtA15_9A167 [Puccinia triticina]